MNRLKIMIILLFGLSFCLPSFSYADTVSTGVGISFAGATQQSNDVPSEDNDRNPGISDPISKPEGTLPQTGELVHSLAVVLIGLLFMMLSVLILIKYREDKEEV